MNSKECKSNDWKINFRKKNQTRFRSGSDLNEKVNVKVELDEQIDESSESAMVKMRVLTGEKTVFDLELEKRMRTRFKPGTELATKVNLLDVEWNQEASESEESIFIGIHLKSSDCAGAFNQN